MTTTERPPPYIGITGITTSHQARTLHESAKYLKHRQLMLGVLVSTKTMMGESLGPRYPSQNTVAECLATAPNVLPMIHYNFSSEEFLRGSAAPQTIQLQTLHERFHAPSYQINACWPKSSALVFSEPSTRIVLQIGAEALRQCAHDEDRLVEKILAYLSITDILLDISGGKGIAFQPEQYIHLIAAVAERIPHVGIGVAGGLCADRLPDIMPLLEQFPFLSIDAETKLRIPENDQLHLTACRHYVDYAQHLFGW